MAATPATLAARIETNESIFNPNKHRLTVLDANEPRPGEAWVYELPATGGNDPIARPTMGGKTIPEFRRRAVISAGVCSTGRVRPSRVARWNPPSNACFATPLSRKHSTSIMNRPYTIATLGSHSALQILKGAHDEGFKTLADRQPRDGAAVPLVRLRRRSDRRRQVLRFHGHARRSAAAQGHHRSARLVRCVPFARRAQEDDGSVLRQQVGARLGSQPRTAARVAFARRPHAAAPV